MTNLEILKAKHDELELQRESVSKQWVTLYKSLRAKITETLAPYVAPMSVQTANIFSELSEENEWYFDFVINVVNYVDGDKVDFGTSFQIRYTNEEHGYFKEERGIAINYGTMGSYTKKKVYQVISAQTIGRVWDKVEEIEKAFREIANSEQYNELLSVYRQSKELEHESDSLNRQIENEKDKLLIEKFAEVGKVLNPKVKLSEMRCFKIVPYCYSKVKCIVITKRTPKTVVANVIWESASSGLHYTTEKREKIEDVLYAIKRGELEIAN